MELSGNYPNREQALSALNRHKWDYAKALEPKIKSFLWFKWKSKPDQWFVDYTKRKLEACKIDIWYDTHMFGKYKPIDEVPSNYC